MKRELTIDSDWFSTLGMAWLLVLSAFCSVRDVVLLAHGRTAQDVSLYTILAAGAFLYLALALRVRRIFRLAALLIGLSSGIRGLAFYAHLSHEAQRLSGINGLVLAATAFLLVSVGGNSVVLPCLASWRGRILPTVLNASASR